MNCWRCSKPCGYPVCTDCTSDGWYVDNDGRLRNWKTKEKGIKVKMIDNMQTTLN